MGGRSRVGETADGCAVELTISRRSGKSGRHQGKGRDESRGKTRKKSLTPAAKKILVQLYTRTFYPLSDGPSIQNRRITNSYFRTCSTCLSHSQAGLCVYTLRLISKQPEPTFERLRYFLGGDRPSQTTRLIVSLNRITALG